MQLGFGLRRTIALLAKKTREDSESAFYYLMASLLKHNAFNVETSFLEHILGIHRGIARQIFMIHESPG